MSSIAPHTLQPPRREREERERREREKRERERNIAFKKLRKAPYSKPLCVRVNYLMIMIMIVLLVAASFVVSFKTNC